MLRQGLLAVALTLVVGCDQVVYEWVDPPIRLAGQDADGPVGDAALDVGFFVDGAFVSLAADDRLAVIHGLQGGTWTMPTVRTQGIAAFATIRCGLTTADGEVVGRVDAKVKFFASADGPLEVQGFPVPVRHAPPHEADPIDDLYGQGATLDCTVSDDDGRRAGLELAVTLVEG